VKAANEKDYTAGDLEEKGEGWQTAVKEDDKQGTGRQTQQGMRKRSRVVWKEEGRKEGRKEG
jgi:hypothetical protein